MADLPTDFWSGYIVIVTVVTFVALGWLVVDVYFSRRDDSEVAEQTWDHDLKEGTSPAPIWWFWFIFSLMITSVIYLMLYPGLGSFKGVLNWSQGGELDASRVTYEDQFGVERRRIAATDVVALAGEPDALRSAGRIYTVMCSSCHGKEAEGQAMLFPNLADDHWQWGATAAQIETTLRNGRTAVMPPLAAVLGDDGVAELAAYVMALPAGRSGDAEFESARTRYAQLCIACHGPDGTGNVLLGAPDLTSGIYTYGGDYAAIYQTIAAGRTGEMPAFGERLDDTQIKLLTAWLQSGAASPN
jgi:cytochrome c oxidase cbb3-type subunit 3